MNALVDLKAGKVRNVIGLAVEVPRGHLVVDRHVPFSPTLTEIAAFPIRK